VTRESAISRATRHFDEGRFIEDLARRVAIRTESQIPESRPYMDVYLKQEIAPAFERMGFKVEILPNPVDGVGPILVAERIEDPNLPTVLSYGHGDVIRGLDEQWRAGLNPWMLKQEGERYYGRGSADNKAQHSINMAALETVIAERGRLGFNAKFMLETGEEVSSPGLRAFCEQHRERLKADVLIASDGPRLSAKRPTLYLGSRGAVNLNFTVELREGAHHSGNWGGLLANPGVRASIEGHCDERGTREYNQALGERRANATRDFLLSQGVPADRMTVTSWGKERPVAAGSDESAWAQNRRAVTVIVR